MTKQNQKESLKFFRDSLREFFEETDCYIFLIAKVYQKAHRILQARLKGFGLTNVQYLVLEALWLFPGITGIELSKILNIDKATLSGIIDRLHKGGWIEKREDINDRRIFRLYASQKSLDIKDELIHIRKRANEKLLSNFSLEEKILFKRFLLEILENR